LQRGYLSRVSPAGPKGEAEHGYRFCYSLIPFVGMACGSVADDDECCMSLATGDVPAMWLVRVERAAPDSGDGQASHRPI
jgi:hypothetical protein